MSSHLIVLGWGLFAILFALATCALCRFLFSRAKAARATVNNRQFNGLSLVALPLIVTDRRGKFVSGLHRENFLVFEDRQLQDIAALSEEDQPMTVGLIVDRSESVRWRHRELTETAICFLESINPVNELFLVIFNRQASVYLPMNVPFKSNLELWKATVQQAPSEGETALYDAMLLAMNQVKCGIHERKALVVISGGEDNASHATLQQVLSVAQRNSVIIYSLAIVAFGQTGSDPDFLKQLAAITGGKAHIINSADKFAGIGSMLARELHQQYTLIYASSSLNQGVFHTLRVEVRSPEHKALFVRTRSGYMGRVERVESAKIQLRFGTG
jgi:Ca-activated chloride channel homolog